MKKLLSDSSKLLVKFLLTKPKIAEKVFVDVKNNKEYKIYDVLDDGTIYLGESSIPFWNHLIKCEKKIPFELFALRVWDAVVGLADENAKTIIAEGLSKYAGLMIPIEWNKDGKPIKFQPMSSTEIEEARTNIVNILSTMAVAVSDAHSSIPGSASEIKSQIEAFIPLGDLINSFAIGIQAYAHLAIPTAWNKEGKPTNFKPMIKDDFELAAYNIQIIMLTAALGLKRAYNSLIKGNKYN